MCRKLSELRESLAGFAARFDPALLTGADAARGMADAVTIENMAATIKALAATRVADTGVWRQAADRSAAHHLARTTGTSVGQAVEAIQTARQLEHLPEVAARARRGELSTAQSSAIADSAAADPAAESRLSDSSRRTSVAELRQECARVEAAAEPDLEPRRARIHRDRFLRSYCDGDGAWNLRVRNNPEVGARIMAALAPITDRLFGSARAEGRREPVEAYAADALTELAATRTTKVTAGAGGDRPRRQRHAQAKVIVRVDLEALLGGYPITGETCELMGFGPVAVSAVRDLIDSGDPFLAAVATKGQTVAGVAHLGRRPTAKQQTALEWLYPECAAEGCASRVRLENDHRVDWTCSHITMVDLMDRLCSHDHGLKTNHGWALVEGTGKRPFVPPDDPRHPDEPRPSSRLEPAPVR